MIIMSRKQSLQLSALFFTLLVKCVLTTDPIATFRHGGKLQGKTLSYEGERVDIFLGVRYAKAPKGQLRFEKPEKTESWKGIIPAIKLGDFCPQLNFFSIENTGQYMGDEDCLFLDVTVPRGLDINNRKPVMVWIHGGGYMVGSGRSYIHTPLAMFGDVITVSINYRVGPLGFLASDTGPSNLGLWDQRAALIWVQENIEAFGGDPNKVTIFGESAGGGSVSNLMISPMTEGLFQRGIAQSGSAYAPWGVRSAKQEQETRNRVYTIFNCTGELWDCLKQIDAEDLIKQLVNIDLAQGLYYGPSFDNEFFTEESKLAESYELSKRFDLLAGSNSQEGHFLTSSQCGPLLEFFNETLDNGMSLERTKMAVEIQLVSMLALNASKELAMEFIVNEYGLDKAADDRDRAYRFSLFAGDIYFGVGALEQLQGHSGGSRSTYGYRFAKYYSNEAAELPWKIYPWLKKGVDHAEDILYTHGCTHLVKNFDLLADEIFPDARDRDGEIKFMLHCTPELMALSEAVMTFWTNFAHSGNPNKPKNLPAGTPEWPIYKAGTDVVMVLDDEMTAVEMPDRQRLTKLVRILRPVMIKQRLMDKAIPVQQSVKVFGLELTVSQAGQALGAVSLACLSLLFSSMRR